MKMLQRLLGRPATLPPAPRTGSDLPGPVPAADADADEQAAACGWFESSHELQRGLWVREHDSPDAVANDLPLASWLEWHLAGWPGRPAR